MRLGFNEIMEISKPRIVVLLVITAVTSMYAASKLVPGTPEPSALNHYYDKDIDPKMERTSKRPIPSGRMAASHVLIYGLVVSCISVIYGFFALNAVSAFFIAVGIFSYVIIYTAWLKRLNTSNIVIGGIAGSAASWAGWSAATGSMDLLGFLVGFLVFVWTPSHFWCLAMKIKDEYAQAEVPMLPVVIGMQKTSKYILGNTMILLPYSLILSFIPDGMGVVYTVIAAVSGGLMLAYHYKLTKTPTSEFAWKAYKVTAPYLTIIFVAVALDAAFHIPLF
ncbi:Protoheme IX farnesyltransferase 1 protein [Marine Group I thaumarchaeote SCGC AAA799-D11]|uniref:Protoheme IX farnesyltransferase n=1 Tax=Marine Group I thaumarchaeote SCGC AAA799-D11 TaxID=1502291 RepID=A0A087RQN9_9ARCH|nr:Protoheme IX farnesyltransferase 1 protein [Marine Group I thaumarchaeote SCGC AAA799-D11]